MTKRSNKTLALAIVIVCGSALSASLPVQAAGLGRPCTDQPSNTWMSLEQMAAKLTEAGMTIKSGSFEKRCGDFYVTDKDGKALNVFVDPATGKIVATKPH